MSDAEANLSEAEKSSISSHSRLHFVFSSMKVMEWILEGSIQVDIDAFEAKLDSVPESFLSPSNHTRPEVSVQMRPAGGVVEAMVGDQVAGLG